MVVDDDRDTIDTMVILLRLWGHEAFACNNGRAAVETAQSFRPDVVLLDLGLPGMDGCEVARQIRRFVSKEETMLVAVTGYGQAADRRHTHDAGFDLHMLKPVNPEWLEAVLATLAINR
jgi:CheY-like chemotaxis protein